MNDVKTWLPLLIAAAGIVGTFAVSQFRVSQVEEQLKELKGEPLRLSILERDVRYVRCELRNIRKLLKSLPEQDCDP